MCVVNGEFIYVTGGSRHDILNDCHRYDININQWRAMQRMHRARSHHSSSQLGGHIYVFCGYDINYNRMNSVEKLYVHVNQNLQL